MHDMVHDLATLLAGEFYFRTEKVGKETKIGSNTRHLSFSKFSDPVLENFDIFGRAKYLRTFLAINFIRPPFNNENASCIILWNLKCLRVLSFCSNPYLVALPDSIDELIYLRYLDLSSTSIRTLPNSLCNLYNLQTLKLYNCQQLIRLPDDMQNLLNLRHLDIRETWLGEMPREMSILNQLQHLSYFVVSKHEKKRIKELGTLSNLHGLLSIRKLENVTNSLEASEARIMEKKYHEELLLFVWSRDANDGFTNSQNEMDIFSKLQPAKNLKRLGIDGYRGTRFPEWVGNPSYQNITWLSLSFCPNCCILPPLGQLCSLKNLKIYEMSMLETIRSEFFENGSSFSETSFPSLECLEFDKMSCWEEWHHPHESYTSFPALKSLVIRDCPRLRGNLPTHLPALETIQIEQCNQLTFSLAKVPSIRKLVIRGSNKVSLHEIPLSLEQLTIQGREVMESIFEAIPPPTSLQSLEIHDCSSRISFPEDYLPASLKILTITGSRNLDFPKQNHLHGSLQQLSIVKSCDSLTTLSLDTLPNLSSLYISQCKNLEFISLPKVLQNLHDFTIQSCPKLVSFPREGLFAPNLTSFNVYKCVSLKSLPCHVSTLLPKLDSLTICDCPEMGTFPERGMPPSLRSLYITNCEILMRSPSLTSMDMLTRISITGPCKGVESFPKEGFALLPPSLTSLDLTRFSSLHTLECTGILHLVSLRILTIRGCPKLKNIAGERLPASLILFQIFECPRLKERCRMKHPQIWHKISHIRGIMGDGGTWIS